MRYDKNRGNRNTQRIEEEDVGGGRLQEGQFVGRLPVPEELPRGVDDIELDLLAAALHHMVLQCRDEVYM